MKTPVSDELLRENAELRARLGEAEETLQAIRSGDVDALVMGQQVYSLAGAETPYRVIFEAMNEGAAILAEDGTVMYANRRMAEMICTPLEGLLGCSLRPIVTPVDLPAFDGLFSQARHHAARADLNLQCQDGKTVPVQLSCAATDKPGAGEFCIVATDLAERKRAEDSLQASEAEFRALAESMPQIVWVTRADGWNIYFNQQWVTYTGLALEESYGHGWSKPFHPDDRQRAQEAWQNATQNLATYSLECRLRRADGTYHWWLIRGVPVRDEHGAILKWFGTCTDIESIKQAELSIQELNTELERRVQERTAELAAANKELEAFAYSVSHDLRAPLRAMDGFSRIALTQHDAELSPKVREALQIVRESAQQMGQLIDELLTFSWLSRQALRKQPVSPLDVVRECLVTLRPETEGRRIEITTGDLPACEADPGLLRQVWMNLLSNALKYSRKSDPAHIEIGCQRNGENVYFIRDNGVGFKMAYADKLFGVFQRLHRAEDFEGTGVGLATVHRIIQRHGGRIWAEAEPNKGATFYFTLAPATRNGNAGSTPAPGPGSNPAQP